MYKSVDGILLVAAAFTINLVVIGISFNYNLLHLEIQDKFNATATESGVIGTVYLGIFNLVTPLTTIACQFVGYRPVVIVGVVMCGTSLISSTFVSEINVLIFSYGILYGLGSNFAHIPALHLLKHHFSGKSYNRACVAILTGIGAGIAITAPLLEKTFSEYGLNNTLRIYGACVICIGLLASVATRLPARKSHGSNRSMPNGEPERIYNHGSYDRILPTTDKVDDTDIMSHKAAPTYISSEKNSTVEADERSIELLTIKTRTIAANSNDVNQGLRSTNDIGQSTKSLSNPEEVAHSKDIVDEYFTNKTINKLKDKVNDDGLISQNASDEVANMNKLYLLKKMLTNFYFWLCQPMFFLYSLAITFSFVSAGNYMHEKGMTSEEIARILSLMGFTDLVTRVLFVVCATCLPVSLTCVTAIMNLVLLVISVLLSIDISTTVVSVLLIGLSLPRALLLVLVLPVCVEIFGKQLSEEAMSVAYFLLGLGSLVSQFFTDNLYDSTGSYKMTLFICAALYGISGISFGFAVFVKRKTRFK